MFSKLVLIFGILSVVTVSCASFSVVDSSTFKMKENIIANNSLFVERLGEGKEAVVFIHGYGVSRKSWYDIVPLLIEEYDIHLIDLMGFGDSPAPTNWSYSVFSQAEAVAKYLSNSDLKEVFVVGHSYGGGVSIILNQLLKKQKDIKIKRMVLISPAAYPQRLPFFIRIPSTPLINRFVVNAFPADFQVRLVLEHIFYDKQLVTDERVSRYVNNISNKEKREAFIKISENIIPDLGGRQIDEIVSGVNVPVNIIYGDHDNVIPESNILRLDKTLEESVVTLIQNCGHVPQEEYPKKVAAVIRRFFVR